MITLLKRNLMILGDAQCPLGSALQQELTVSNSIPQPPKFRISHLNPEHLLFVNGDSFDQTKLANEPSLQSALKGGIPILIQNPEASLLTTLTGLGVENAEAVLLVKGKNRVLYSRTYKGSGSLSIVAGEDSALLPEGEQSIKTVPSISSTFEEVESDITQSIMEDIENLDNIETYLETLSQNKSFDKNIPENRTWSHLWEMSEWKTSVRQDPSEETENTQTHRFKFSVLFSLIAADDPAKVKIFSTEVLGTGFEPIISEEEMMRNDNKHRGWAQSMTYVEFDPQGDEFGNIADYVPINTSNEVTVTAGFSWSVGFEAGVDGEGGNGKLSASFSQDQSHTISTTDFQTLAESIGERGMRFYHNAHVVGGDTIVDTREFFKDGWNDEKDKMFYTYAVVDTRVRSWPSLSMELLKPDSSCVWFAKDTETRTGTIKLTGVQGMNYFYKKGSTKHQSRIELVESDTISIDFSSVNYDDPQ